MRCYEYICHLFLSSLKARCFDVIRKQLNIKLINKLETSNHIVISLIDALKTIGKKTRLIVGNEPYHVLSRATVKKTQEISIRSIQQLSLFKWMSKPFVTILL